MNMRRGERGGEGNDHVCFNWIWSVHSFFPFHYLLNQQLSWVTGDEKKRKVHNSIDIEVATSPMVFVRKIVFVINFQYSSFVHLNGNEFHEKFFQYFSIGWFFQPMKIFSYSSDVISVWVCVYNCQKNNFFK